MMTAGRKYPVVSHPGSRYIYSEAAHMCDQYIDKGDYSSIVQDNDIHAIRRSTY